MAKKYEELGFTDDFIFCKVLTDSEELCRQLLELILDMKIRKVVNVNKQKNIEITADGRGIRLDVYAEDADGTVYDVEMQTTKQSDLPRRSRYYQGMIDLNLIERGARFAELKKSFVIFICLEDPFQKGLPVYTFKNMCSELPGLELCDDAIKVFINADGKTDGMSEEMKNFLAYLNGRLTNEGLVGRLQAEVEKARQHEEWRAEYMTLLMRDQENIEKGRKEGLEAGRKEGLEAGRAEGISVLVNSLKAAKQTNAFILDCLMQNYALSESEAKKYI